VAVREGLRRRSGVELPVLIRLPRAVLLRGRERSSARRPRLDVPRAARVRIEVEAVDVEDAHVRIVIWIVLTVALVVDDLDRSVVARRALVPAGVGGIRPARGEEEQGDAHEDREVARCLAHRRLRLSFRQIQGPRNNTDARVTLLQGGSRPDSIEVTGFRRTRANFTSSSKQKSPARSARGSSPLSSADVLATGPRRPPKEKSADRRDEGSAHKQRRRFRGARRR